MNLSTFKHLSSRFIFKSGESKYKHWYEGGGTERDEGEEGDKGRGRGGGGGGGGGRRERERE